MLTTDENSFSLPSASEIKCLLPCSGAVWCDRYILAASFSSSLLATHFSFHLILFLFVFSCPPTPSLSSSSSWRYLRERSSSFYSFFVPYQLGENKNDKWINVEKENQVLSDFFDFIFRGFLFDGLQIPKQLYVWRSFLTQILLRIQNSRWRKNTWRCRASSRTTSPFMIGISRPDCGTRDCFDRYSKSETIKCRSVEDLSVLHFYFLWWLKSLFELYSLYTCLLSSFPSFVLSFFVLCALIILLFPMIAMHAEPPSWSGRALEWGRALRARWHESSGPLVVAIIAETMTAANNATNIA